MSNYALSKGRQSYKINDQFQNAGNFQELIPLGYHEVAPGTTLSGQCNCRIISDNTDSMILNRAYFDIYVFYAPLRVLDENFADRIASIAGFPLPTVDDIFPQNFEKGLVHSSGTTNCAYLRYMYNHVWNEYFSRPGDTLRGSTDTGLARVRTRPSTFFHSILDTDVVDTSGGEVDTSGGSFNVDDLEVAYAESDYVRAVETFGRGYEDTLARCGVKYDNDVLERAERLAVVRSDFQYKSNMLSQGLGQGFPGGVYDGVVNVRVSSKYLPEHGIVGVYAVPRIEVMREGIAGPPILGKLQYNDFWLPEYEVEQFKEWPNKLFGYNNADGQDFVLPNYHEYRQGHNIVGQLTSLKPLIIEYDDATTPGTSEVDDFRDINPDDLGDLWDNVIDSTYHLRTSAEMRFDIKSPVSRPLTRTTRRTQE
jgi:hypothetical protein